MEDNIVIQYSAGQGRSGQRYAYIRPAGKCSNKSIRCKVQDIEKTIAKHFPEVHYYNIDSHIIGAKNEAAALKEYWRICERSKIRKPFQVNIAASGTKCDEV